MPHVRLAVATLLVPLLMRSLPAQSVEGRMVQETGAAPVPGAFVILTDTAGVEVARALTRPDGRFTLRAPAPGRYRLTSAVIGWHATTSPSVVLGRDATLHYTFVVRPRPVQLDALVVTGERRCAAASDSANRAVVTVWEEARKALSAVSWTGRSALLRFRWIEYERRLDPRSLRVLADSSTEQHGVYERGPFATTFPDSLFALGFVRQLESGEWHFESPDADAFLSVTFAELHCFDVVAHENDRALIGLAFRPVKGHDLSEIAGTLWLDRHSGELRWLEFNFVQLPWRIPNDDIGGRVEFQRLPTGAWIVRRWRLRMPIVEIRRVAEAGAYRMRERATIQHIEEEGALVTEVRHGDGSAVALGAPATLTGVIYDSLGASPLSGAEVVLRGTSYRTTANGAGRFAFHDVPSGTYVAQFHHPRLDGAPPIVAAQEVSVRPGDTVAVWLGVPAHASVWRLYCPDAPPGDTLALVAGRVTRGSHERAVGATVAARWTQWALETERMVTGDAYAVTALAGADGVYAICGAPAGLPVELRASLGDAESRPVTIRLVAGEIRRVDLELTGAR